MKETPKKGVHWKPETMHEVGNEAYLLLIGCVRLGHCDRPGGTTLGDERGAVFSWWQLAGVGQSVELVHGQWPPFHLR